MVQTAESKHTPGKWTAVTGQGAHHRDMYIRAGERRADGTWPAVAKCCSTAIGARVVVEANARLIAAAPALYDVCKRLDDAVGFFVAALPTNHAVAKDLISLRDAARAAIAQAEGGAA